MQSLLWYLTVLAVSAASRDWTDISNCSLIEIPKGQESTWRLVMVVERAALKEHVELQHKFVQLLLRRLRATGGIFEVLLYPFAAGTRDRDGEIGHIPRNDSEMLEKVDSWFARLPRYEFAAGHFPAPLDQILGEYLRVVVGQTLSHDDAPEQAPYRLSGLSECEQYYGKLKIYSVKFFDEKLQYLRSESESRTYEGVFFGSFQEFQDLSVLLRTEVPQVKWLAWTIIRYTNGFEIEAIRRDPGNTFDKYQVLFDGFAYFLVLLLAYTSIICSLVVVAEQMRVIRKFDPLAHINLLFHNGF